MPVTPELTRSLMVRIAKAYEFRSQRADFVVLLRKQPKTVRLFFKDYMVRWVNAAHLNNIVEQRTVERFLRQVKKKGILPAGKLPAGQGFEYEKRKRKYEQRKKS